MTRVARARGLAGWFVALAVVPGCAARSETMAPPAVTKSAPVEPTTLEEAQAQLERARADLQGVLLPAGNAGPTSTATPHAEVTTEQADRPSSAAQPPPPACANACRAEASMKRAVDAICRMTSDADARCVDARRTLEDSKAKVAGCGC